LTKNDPDDLPVYIPVSDYTMRTTLSASLFPNESGTLNEIEEGIDIVCGNDVQTGSGPYLSLADHIQSIIDNHPLVARFEWSNGDGHALVVSGYEGRGTSSPQLRLIDPWGDTPTDYYPYYDLTNGCQIGTGTGTYSHSVWVN
jgi:hypothetical protein